MFFGNSRSDRIIDVLKRGGLCAMVLILLLCAFSSSTVFGYTFDFQIDPSSSLNCIKVIQKSTASSGFLILDYRSDSNKILKIVTQPFTTYPLGEVTLGGIDLPPNTAYVNSYIWNGLDNIQPIAEKFTVSETVESANTGFLPMGMNIGGVGYYFNRNLMFNDIMKTSSNLLTISWQPYPVDLIAEDGYPLGIGDDDFANRATVLINNIYDGEYVLLYDGQGTFGFGPNIEVIQSNPNAITLKLTEIPLDMRGVPGQDHCYFNILSSSYDDRVRNIRIIPKEFENNESEMPLFNKPFTDGLKNLNVIRYMEATKTNGSTQKNWEDRSKVEDFSYTANGVPLEYLIELSNTLNIDPWFCVPHMASDDYIENMAYLIKDRLNTNLKAYIEYSNEIWHRGFTQGVWVNENAPGAVDEYVSNDLQALDGKGVYSGRSDHLKEAYMMSRTFRIFDSVFAEQSRDRLVTVGVTVASVWIEYVKEMFNYWSVRGEMPDCIATSAYFGFETSSWNDSSIPQDVLPRENAAQLNGYFHNIWNCDPDNVTADHIIDAVQLLWEYTYAPGVVSLAQLVKESGAKLLVYEGGQHMQPHQQGNWEYNQAVYDAQISPRMYDLYMNNYRLFKNSGYELFANFSYVGHRESQYGSWGVVENLDDIYNENLKQLAPKFRALMDANIKLIQEF